MDDQTELRRVINNKAISQIPSHAWDCTTPIVITHDGALHPLGTGTFFRVADHFLLVTAGHVIKEACEHGKTLAIGGADDGHFIALTGDTLVSSEGRGGTSADPLDIALHRLAPDAVARLSKKRFLLFNNIEFDPQSLTAVYTLFGFPAMWSSSSSSADEKVTYRALQYTAYRYERDTSTLKGFQERLHLLLDGQLHRTTDEDGSPTQFCDSAGESVPFPRGLGGISGCSVWRIGDLNMPFDDWDVEQSRVVAVQTGVYHKKHAIKATRWVAVSTMIYRAFPELRQVMEGTEEDRDLGSRSH